MPNTGKGGQIISYHPTVAELRMAGERVEEARNALTAARSILHKVSRISNKDTLETAAQSLTPIISFLYESLSQFPEWADAKEVQIWDSLTNPHLWVGDHPDLTFSKKPRQDGKCQGCVDANFAFGEWGSPYVTVSWQNKTQ